jgi:hypothetical protein
LAAVKGLSWRRLVLAREGGGSGFMTNKEIEETLRHVAWRVNNFMRYARQHSKNETSCLDFLISVEEEVSKMLEALGSR